MLANLLLFLAVWLAAGFVVAVVFGSFCRAGDPQRADRGEAAS